MFLDPSYNPYKLVEDLKAQLMKANILLLEVLEQVPDDKKEGLACQVFNHVEDSQNNVLLTNQQLYS